MDIGKDLFDAFDGGYRNGLSKTIEVIEIEVEYAKTINPQMAMGMNRIKELIEKELEY